MAKRERRGAARPGAESGKSPAAEGAASEKKDEERGANGLIEWLKSIAVAAIVFVVLRTFIVQTFVITSGSMMDTLLVGDFLVVNRAAIGSHVPFTDLRIPGYSEPRRFDVIVFDPAHEDTLMLVKRLIGMPGDVLEMRDRQLFIDGEPVDEPYVEHIADPRDELPDPRFFPPDRDMSWQVEHLAPGVDPASYRPSRDNWGPLVIPEGYYFMLGDNREQSLDSRYWGLVEGWRLEGRAVFIYYSYDRDSQAPFRFLSEVRWNRIGDRIR